VDFAEISHGLGGIRSGPTTGAGLRLGQSLSHLWRVRIAAFSILVVYNVFFVACSIHCYKAGFHILSGCRAC